MSDCGCHPIVSACSNEGRRALLNQTRDWNGIDYVDVGEDQSWICVHLFGPVPAGLTARNVHICGGRRIRDIRVTGVEIHRADDPDLDDCLRVYVDRRGDFSTYCLCIGQEQDAKVDACGYPVDADAKRWAPLDGFDPRYSCAEFSFKANCSLAGDCAEEEPCLPEHIPPPAIDYLAKDYQSFKRLLLDRLAVTLPGWRERHAPDLMLTLVEVLAYVADRLSYYQDAVATEAYLDTARLRTSVRRHLRLIDYRLHEGCNARALLTLSGDGELKLGDVAFSAGADLIFEPMSLDGEGTVHLVAAQAEMRFYTWGDAECCLLKGATRATLRDAPKAWAEGRGRDHGQNNLGLRGGDILIFEEVIGPTTGRPEDADRRHRHAVRLREVRADHDPLLRVDVVEIDWAAEDALPFELCLSSVTEACERVDDVSVARGNVILVDQGRKVNDPPIEIGGVDVRGPCGCEDGVQEAMRSAERTEPATLLKNPVTHAAPVQRDAPASALLLQDVREALPQVRLEDGNGAWTARLDLLSCAGDERCFVVECEPNAPALLRFGDDVNGARPAPDSKLTPVYRIGGGREGNVGADTITTIIAAGATPFGLSARNPLPAAGGQDPEPLEQAKLFAPSFIRQRRGRAIVAEDYAALARDSAGLQGTAAALAWSGSWREAVVSLDSLAGEASAELCAHTEARLERYRRLGHDLRVTPAKQQPIVVELTVCVEDWARRADVEALLRRRLGAKPGADGLLHADRLSFGQGVSVSRLLAEAQAVEGVRHAEVTQLERFPPRAPPDRSAIASGVLSVESDVVAQAADDPNYPERGGLVLVMAGGR